MHVLMAQVKEASEGWLAKLCLAYDARSDGTTILSHTSHSGPLRVQQPLYPEDRVCHTYILHPPGGVVGGDRLEVELCVNPGASALITTPGATKFYRSDGPLATQIQRLSVCNGTLEWFPQDTIVFPGARAILDTEVRLSGRGIFIGWEVLCLGLPSRRQRFEPGFLTQRLSVFHNETIRFRERLAIECSADLDSATGLRGFPVTATMVATGVAEDWLQGLDGALCGEEGLAALSLLDDILVVRYLGHSTFAARARFQRIWSCLRPFLVGRVSCPPRIWST